MRNALLALTLILGTVPTTGCLAGPHQLRRSVADWDQRLYVDSPWLDVALWIVPVVPLAYAIAFGGDVLITDAYAFWFEDAMRGRGTGFRHAPTGAVRRMKSLVGDDGSWMTVERTGRTPDRSP